MFPPTSHNLTPSHETRYAGQNASCYGEEEVVEDQEDDRDDWGEGGFRADRIIIVFALNIIADTCILNDILFFRAPREAEPAVLP